MRGGKKKNGHRPAVSLTIELPQKTVRNINKEEREHLCIFGFIALLEMNQCSMRLEASEPT